MNKYVKCAIKGMLIISCAYLIILIGGFFGIKNGLTNTAGIVDGRSGDFSRMDRVKRSDQGKHMSDANSTEGDMSEKERLLCQIDAVGVYNPINAEKIALTYLKTNSSGLADKMVFAVQMRLADNLEFVDRLAGCRGMQNMDLAVLVEKYANREPGGNAFPWMNDDEWRAISDATAKDVDVINRAAQDAQIPSRLIVSNLIVEQLRLFHSQRELFKKVFEPLKILGNATKISLGVMGVKEATAIDIENHLKDPTSEYYPGKSFEHKLDFLTDNPAQERFDRLTDDKSHYYSYLYAALYLKEIMTQWERAGYDIRYRPEIVGTLFNVGFPQSKPNADPKVGGSEIGIGDAKYSFGSLAYEFYYSGEMEEAFPYVTK